MIHVLAHLELNPGTRDKWLAEFHALMPKVHAEDGCLAYEPCIDIDSGAPAQVALGPDRVVIIERWRDMAALKAHFGAPHMGPYRDAVKPFVKATTLQVLTAA
ncbi:MAG: antibiotic biosynthesis monooxygenase [Acetobacteraceae bacterium]|nr:antibiotic biosynthesis monooxygenase [Acetobacteraceae bacterium]